MNSDTPIYDKMISRWSGDGPEFIAEVYKNEEDQVEPTPDGVEG